MASCRRKAVTHAIRNRATTPEMGWGSLRAGLRAEAIAEPVDADVAAEVHTMQEVITGKEGAFMSEAVNRGRAP